MPDTNRKQYLLSAVRRNIWLRSLQNRLDNHDFSIISNTCVGGAIYKDLNMQFLTPTINLKISPCDFIKMCRNLEFYMEQELVEETTEKDYPVGRISDITIQFRHYPSFHEAYTAWNRRKARLKYDNIFVIMQDGKHLTAKDRNDFQLILYPKVLFVPFETQMPYEFHISGFEERGHLGDILQFQQPGMRYYEQFDFVSFLNQKDIAKTQMLD